MKRIVSHREVAQRAVLERDIRMLRGDERPDRVGRITLDDVVASEELLPFTDSPEPVERLSRGEPVLSVREQPIELRDELGASTKTHLGAVERLRPSGIRIDRRRTSDPASSPYDGSDAQAYVALPPVPQPRNQPQGAGAQTRGSSARFEVATEDKPPEAALAGPERDRCEEPARNSQLAPSQLGSDDIPLDQSLQVLRAHARRSLGKPERARCVALPLGRRHHVVVVVRHDVAVHAGAAEELGVEVGVVCDVAYVKHAQRPSVLSRKAVEPRTVLGGELSLAVLRQGASIRSISRAAAWR